MERLDTVRGQFLAHVSGLSTAQLQTVRPFPDGNYEISPAWTLHHLMQHEAEHRGQIYSIRSFIESAS